MLPFDALFFSKIRNADFGFYKLEDLNKEHNHRKKENV